jgi:hypothetical protein
VDCSATVAGYTKGTTVTLIATPDAGFWFAGWSGACSGTGPCAVNLSDDTEVWAHFARPRLTVRKIGNGIGMVTSTPLGITCGADCTGTYAAGTGVTLSAVAQPGSIFAGWTAGSCSGTGPCTVTVSGDTVVRATFTLASSQNAAADGSTGAELTRPAPGATLSGSTETFGWTSGSGLRYGLQIGSRPGTGDLYERDEGLRLWARVTGLPTDGRTVYVRLWTLVGAEWVFDDYAYTAAGGAGAGAGNFSLGQTTASQGPLRPGQPVAITVTVTNAGPAASGVTVRLEVHRDDGLDAEVFRDDLTYTGLSFAAGESKTVTFVWPVPGDEAAGSYVVKLGVFSDDYSILYVWDDAGVSLTMGP